MDRNDYFELGVKLAFEQNGFAKNAKVMAALKALFKKAPNKKGGFEAFKKSKRAKKLMGSSSATDSAAFQKVRGAAKRRVA